MHASVMKTVILLLIHVISIQCFALQIEKEPAMIISSVGDISKDTLLAKDDTLAGDTPALKRPKENSSLIKIKSRLSPYVVPALFLSYGIMSLNNGAINRIDHELNHEMVEGRPFLPDPLENNLQYAPVIAVYALNVAGIKGRSNFLDRSAMYFLSNSLTSFAVSFGKDKFSRVRPSGGLRSFPSGHTAIAFAGAEFMRQEYKDVSPWYGYAGYSVAALTGALRMAHNKHWLSDVVAGAGIGILSTKFTYVAYPWLKEKVFGKKSNFQVLPSYQSKTFGLAFVASF